MTTDKHKREDDKTRYNRNNKKNPHYKLELGEELNLEPRLRPVSYTHLTLPTKISV